MLSPLRKRYIRVGFVSASIALVLFLVSLTVWERYLAAVGYEALAAFTAILCIASLLLHQQGDRPSAPILLIAGFLYYAIIELGGAIEKLLLATSPLLQKTDIVLASDLLEMSALGVVFLLALVWHQKGVASNNKRRNVSFLLLLIGPLLLSGFMRLIILEELPEPMVMLIGVAAGIFSIIVLLGSSIVIIRNDTLFPLNGPVRLPLACAFLAFSSIPSMIALFIPGTIWTLTIIIQLTAFVNIYLALSPTFLGKFDVPKRAAFFLILGIMILMVFPFLITLLSESILPNLRIENSGAYAVSKIGSTSMSAALAILIYTYAKRTKKKHQLPIAFIFSFLTIVGLLNLFLTPFLLHIQAESMSTLILVTLFAIPAFVQSVRWMDEPSSQKSGRSPETWIILGFVGGACLVILGEIIQSIVLTSDPSLDNSPLGGCIVLALNAIAIGEFVYLDLLVGAKNHGQITVESLSIGFLSLWILQNILKGIFLEWTVGWWLGEILLLIGFLSGPAFMGYLYLGAFLRAEESGTRAKVFADVLAHDISNHHQAILSALEIARLDVVPDEIRNRALNDAYLAIADADSLAKNVRKLGQIDEIELDNLQPMDLVVSITESFNRLTKAIRAPDIKLNLENAKGEHFIRANALLHDIFLNLFRNAIEYSGKGQVDVVISAIQENNTRFWEVRVIDYGPGIPYDQREMLFERYMKGAKGSGLGLSVIKALTELFGGTVRIEDRVKGDFSQGSAFVLVFPAFSPLEIV